MNYSSLFITRIALGLVFIFSLQTATNTPAAAKKGQSAGIHHSTYQYNSTIHEEYHRFQANNERNVGGCTITNPHCKSAE